MKFQIKQKKLDLNFLYYLSFFLVVSSAFIYSNVLNEYARFILGFTAFASGIIYSSFFLGAAFGAFFINKYKSPNFISLKFLVYLLLCTLIFILISNYFFQEFIENSDNYIVNTLFAIIILFLYGIVFSFILVTLYCNLPKAQNESNNIYNFYTLLFISISATSIFYTFWLLDTTNIKNSFLVSCLLIIFSILINIFYYYFGLNLSKEESSIAELEKKFNTPWVISSFILLISCATAMYFLSWLRLLELTYGSSLQIISIIISAFFLSLSSGSFILKSKKVTIGSSIGSLANLCLIASSFAVLIYSFYSQNFLVTNYLKSALNNTNNGYELYIFSVYFIVFINFFFSIFIVGSIFPITTNLISKDSLKIPVISNLLVFTMLGLVLGTIFTYSFGFTYLGTKFNFLIAIFLIISSAILLCLCKKEFFSKKTILLLSFTGILFLYCLVWVPNVNTIISPALVNQDIEEGFFNDFVFEGRNSTVNVRARKQMLSSFTQEHGISQKIINNSNVVKNGAQVVGSELYSESLHKDDIKSVILAALALSISSNSENIMSIGFDSGFTQSLLLTDESLKKLDTVEIEPGIVKAGLLLGDKNKRVYQDSRSNIIINDVINFLKTSKDKYNIIISNYETSYFPENAFTFTKEFYSLAEKRLYEDGILVQKIDISTGDFKTLGSIFNALSKSFSYYNFYFASNNHLIIVASNSKIPKISEKKFEKLAFKEFLNLSAIESVNDLNVRYAADQSVINLLLVNDINTVNSYFNKQAGLQSGKHLFMKEGVNEISFLNQNNLLAHLTDNNIINGPINVANDYDKTKLYKDAQNLYNGIMFNPTHLKNSDDFILLSQNNFCLNAQQKWFDAFVNASNLIINFLPDDEGENIYSKIVTSHCFNSLPLIKQQYMNFVKGVVNKDYYFALQNAERVLAGNQQTKLLNEQQKATLFKYIMYLLIKVGRPELTRTVFDLNHKQLNLKQGSQNHVEILFLYLYASDLVDRKK